MLAQAQTSLPRIVVLGAGFAGLTFCRKFPSGLAHVTVIDRQNHHLFQPLLYQVATAGLSAIDIAQPIRAILRSKRDFEVLMGEVTGIDLAERKVLLNHGEVHYDYLVIALGGISSYFGHDDWAVHAPGLKSLDDALKIRRKILLAFEEAETESNEQRRRELMTMIVIGGGPTGVELAGTFAELARTVLVRDFDRIDPSKARVILIEGGPRVLGTFAEDSSASALRQLERLGVEVRLGKQVQAIRANEVEMSGGEILRGNVIWAAGVAASPLTKKLGVETDRAGRIKVAPDLSIPGHPEVFALGDIVSLVDRKGQVVPGVSPAAIQMGEHVVKLIVQSLRDRRRSVTKGSALLEREAFGYWNKGTMATIGRSKAVAEFGKVHISGYLAWISWLFVHLIFLVGMRNRISVFMQWTYSYFTYKRGARIITGVSGEPPAGSA
jgi:NADH dehydrogenase